MYRLRLSRREKKKLLRSKWLIVFLALVGVGLIVWFVWIRPVQNETKINSFQECADAGNPIQESYPEVCLTKDGERFVNPKQDQAHQESVESQEELIPPSSPAHLKLDVREWGVRVPLTAPSFDLIYTYIENGGEEYLMFAYKRLVRDHICEGDIGMRLSRSLLQNQFPFSPNKPAPTAKVGEYYYYITYAGSLCYDDKKAEQVALVKEVVGDQSITQATADLLSKMILIPKE